MIESCIFPNVAGRYRIMFSTFQNFEIKKMLTICRNKKGTLALRGLFWTTNPKMYQTNRPYENFSHFWVIFGFCFERLSKHILNPCSHIEFNTQNPNPIIKIPLYCTKYPQHAKILSNFWNKWDKSKTFKTSDSYFIIYISCIIHIL